jgi:hypothetical protein
MEAHRIRTEASLEGKRGSPDRLIMGNVPLEGINFNKVLEIFIAATARRQKFRKHAG